MKIAIVGAGLTGLTAAYQLSLRGHKVALFEENTEPGGLASVFNAGQERLERFYHHIFTSDTYVIDLAEKLGLKEHIEWFEPNNAIYFNNRLYPFTSPLDLIKFTPLSFISRVRTGLLVLSSRFIKDYSSFENITAREWLSKRAGADSYEKIWGPLLESKFDKDAEHISGTWIWNKFKLRGASRGKNISKEQLGYMKGSFGLLIEALRDAVIANGGTLKTNHRIMGLQKNADKSFSLIGTEEDQAFDRILFTASPEALAQLDTPLSADYIGKLLALRSKSNICLTLALKKSLSPYYWITIAQKDIPFVLAIEHTRLVGQRGYGSHIVYLSRYIDAHDALYQMNENEVTRIFLDGLKRMFPDFSESDVINTTLSKARYAQPIVVQNYANKLLPVKTPVEGLFLASMSQIYPEDRGLNYAVRLGLKAADEVLKD